MIRYTSSYAGITISPGHGIGLWPPKNGLKVSWDIASFLATAPHEKAWLLVAATATILMATNELYGFNMPKSNYALPVKIPRFFCHLRGGQRKLNGSRPSKKGKHSGNLMIMTKLYNSYFYLYIRTSIIYLSLSVYLSNLIYQYLL